MTRQQDILFKAVILALFALGFTYLLARRLASNLSQPHQRHEQCGEGDSTGATTTRPLPVVDDGELGSLARHINNLAART
jgi:two-component system, sensor histidine kinase